MKKVLFLPIIFFFFFLLNSSAYSQTPKQGRPFLNADATGDPRVFGATGSASPVSSGSSLLNQKLSGIRLQACERVSQNITKRSQELLKRASQIENIFYTHAMAVENYYLGKLAPSGKTLANFDALSQEVQTRKIAVDSSILIATSNVSLNCQGNNPAFQVQSFRSNMLSVIQSLLEYKKSVVDLIVAVANLGGVGTGSVNATNSARPLPMNIHNSTGSGLQK